MCNSMSPPYVGEDVQSVEEGCKGHTYTCVRVKTSFSPSLPTPLPLSLHDSWGREQRDAMALI